MKYAVHVFFALFFFICILEASFGQGDAPPLLKGQAQISSSVGAFIHAPNNQVTKINSSTALIESNNKNILSNPSFEHSSFATSWTNNGTEVGVVETTTIIDGKKAISFNPSSETINLTQTSPLYAANFADGVQGLAMCRIRSAVALTMCSIQNSVVSTTDCVTTNTDSKWSVYKVPFILGGTNNGVSIAGTALTGSVKVDDCFVAAVDLKQDTKTCTTAPCSTELSAKISNTGVVSEENVDWISGNCAISATSTATCTHTTGLGVTTTLTCTYGIDGGDGFIRYAPASSSTQTVFRARSLAGADVAAPFHVICQKGGTDYLTAKSLESGKIYSSNCGANCVDTFSAAISVTGVTSNENADFINGNTVLATSVFTGTFNTGIFTVAPNCVAVTAAGGFTKDVDVTTTSTTFVARTSTTTLGTASDSAFGIVCQKQGADFIATRSIIGTFVNVPVLPGVINPSAVRSAVLNCDAGSVITSQKGTSWVSSIGNISAGACAITLVAGAFSDTPDCSLTWASPGAVGQIVNALPSSSTAISIDCEDDASAACTSYDATIFCVGAK